MVMVSNRETADRARRPVRALKSFQTVLLAAVVAGCGDARDTDITGALPPLPEIDLAAFEEAVRAQFERTYDEAVASPEDGEANGRLGMMYHAYERFEEAEVCYRRATRLAPQDYRWWYYLGIVQARGGRSAESVRSLERSVSSKGDFVPALLSLGTSAFQEHRLDEARRWFARALESSPRSPHALLGIGRVLFKQGDIDGAIAHYQQALDLAPSFAAAIYNLALAHRARGEVAKAQELLDRHASADRSLEPPDHLFDELQALRLDSNHLLRRAAALFKDNQFADALELYRRILRWNPDVDMARYNICLCLQRLNRHQEALPCYEDVLRRQPDRFEAQNNLGICYLELGRADEAIECFREATAIEPRYYRAHFNLGLAFERKRLPEQAIEHFRKAVSIHPVYPEAQRHLGFLYHRTANRDRAIEHFVEVLKVQPDDPVTHLGLAKIFEEESNRQALGDSGESPAAAPQSALAYRRAAAFLRKSGLHAAAIHSLREAIRQFEQDWRTAVALAWMLAASPHERLRRPEEALRLVEPICREVAGDDPSALDTLAVAYAAVGRYEDALSSARAALRLAEQLPSSPQAEHLKNRIAARLRLYGQGKPFHDK